MTIPDEAVEAAAKELRESRLNGRQGLEWRQLDSKYQDEYRKSVRAVLEAAAPILMAQAWNEGCAATTRAVRSGADYPVNPYKVVP